MKGSEIIGLKFGKLTVTDTFKTTSSHVMCTCLCDCGNTLTTRFYGLRDSYVKSCGCSRKKHGMYGTPTYKSWDGMKYRCNKSTSKDYVHYGGRGITVCVRWQTSFQNFLDDMGERPNGHTLDRIDTNGNYEPTNCRWATTSMQVNNRRKFISPALRKYGTFSLQEIADVVGCSLRPVHNQLAKGKRSPKFGNLIDKAVAASK